MTEAQEKWPILVNVPGKRFRSCFTNALVVVHSVVVFFSIEGPQCIWPALLCEAAACSRLEGLPSLYHPDLGL